MRARIEAGELAPGDRVPSTREITRQWDVAMATATKVLTALRQRGPGRARCPGVGTVVDAGRAGGSAGAAPDRKTADRALHPQRIVAAAIAIADAEGLAAVSMRRVAAELGVATMSLYRHVADKDDLLAADDRRRVRASGRCPPTPARAGGTGSSWPPRMLWAMFRRHPWLAPALSVTRPQPVANAMRLHRMGARRAGRPRPRPRRRSSPRTSRCSTTCAAPRSTWSRRTRRRPLSGLDAEEWIGTQEPALDDDPGRRPVPDVRAAGDTEGYEFDLDELFEFGLQRLLDGFAMILDVSTP